MSWQATRWAKLWRLGGTARKAILLVTADYSNHEKGPDGEPVPAGWAVSWASLDVIAEGAEVNERTVRRTYDALETAGVLRRERRHDRRGYRMPDAVWLPIGQLPGDLTDTRSPVGLADTRGPLGLVDNQSDGAGSDPGDGPPTGHQIPGLPDTGDHAYRTSDVRAGETSVDRVEEPPPPGLPTQLPTARATVDDDDGRRYATARAELQRLPDLGMALIEEVRGALPGSPDLMTLVITAGDLSRERRRRTG